MIWPWLIDPSKEETPPPILKEVLDNGVDVWAFGNSIPQTAREAVEDIFLYRRICTKDVTRFLWAFRAIIRKTQWRFLNLLRAEAYEYDPFITNMLTEASDKTSDHSDSRSTSQTGGTEATAESHQTDRGGSTATHRETTDAANEAKTTERSSSTRTSAEHSAETGDETASTVRGEKTETAKAGDSVREASSGKNTTGESAKTEARSDNEVTATAIDEQGSTHRTGLESSTESHDDSGDEALTEKTDRATVRGESTSASKGNRVEKSLSDDYSRTTTDDSNQTTERKGSEVRIGTQDAGFSRTSTTGHAGAETRQRQGAEVGTTYPEQDSSAEIAALQGMAAGQFGQPALTYATAGTYSGELERTGYDNRQDTTTETRAGAEYSIQQFGRIDGIPGMTTTPRIDTEDGHRESVQTGTGAEIEQARDESTGRTDATESGSEGVSRNGTKTTRGASASDKTEHATEATDKRGATSGTKLAEGQVSESGKTHETGHEDSSEMTSTTGRESGRRTESSTEEHGRESRADREGREGGEEARASDASGASTTATAGATETESSSTREATSTNASTTTGKTREDAHRVGLEAARRILSGRSGMSPQALLADYESFVLNSRALEWLCDELEPAFFQIERSY